jgi:hypothetical protein
MNNAYQHHYEILSQKVIASMHSAWDVAIGVFDIGIKAGKSEYFYEKNGSRKDARREVPLAVAMNGLNALIALRDQIYLETGRRLWGLTMMVYPDHKMEVTLSYEKPATDTYDDTPEWHQYLVMIGAIPADPQHLMDDAAHARDSLYASFGDVDPHVIAPMINPAFSGGPAWPALRQAFSVIRRDNHTLVISNGLTDPFAGETKPNVGFGIELYAETTDLIEGDISHSRLFQLVYAVALQAAYFRNMAELINQYGVITLELPAEECGYPEYQNDNGKVGVMIGIKSPDLPECVTFPGGDVFLASIQVLTPNELAYVAAFGAEGRLALAQHFNDSGLHHFVMEQRNSLVASSD